MQIMNHCLKKNTKANGAVIVGAIKWELDKYRK